MRRQMVFITLAGILALSGCSKKDTTAPSDTKKSSDANPALIAEPQKAAPLKGLTYVKGSPVAFEAGKIYVVEFWATWCPPCRESIPHLTEIQKHYKDKGVVVLGISSESVGTVKPFVEKMTDKMEYIVAVDTEGSVGKGYMEAYNQNGIPTAFLVDGKGNVVWYGHPMGELDSVLQKLTAAAG